MNTITVSKSDLQAKLIENREAHAAKVTRSRTVYREKIIEELDKRLADARGGRDIDPGFLHMLPIPRDYTVEYDRAIDQLQWEIADTIELTQQEFNRYVRDEWEWVREFAASTATYLAQ